MTLKQRRYNLAKTKLWSRPKNTMQYSKVSQKMQPLGKKSMERSSRS